MRFNLLLVEEKLQQLSNDRDLAEEKKYFQQEPRAIDTMQNLIL